MTIDNGQLTTRRNNYFSLTIACCLLPIAFLFIILISPDANAENYFNYGIASGDPLQNKVILWTRVQSDENIAKVSYEVSKDDNFQKIVNIGEVKTDKSRDYTIKIDIENLKPDTYYYYRFKYKDTYSISGRTKTLPEETNKFKIAVVACQNFNSGYFTPYKNIVEDNPDVIIMLGDFIYENPRIVEGSPRFDTSGIGRDLESYRAKYKHYRSDPFLTEAMSKIPFISVWDDHEVMNDYSGITMKKKDPKRLYEAYKAYLEYIPVREQEIYKIYRSFKIGTLIDLFMSDGRQYRDESACEKNPSINPECIMRSHQKGRSYLGNEQKKWLIDGISSSNAQWQVWGNNTVLMDMRVFSMPANYDQWDGFNFEKEEILKSLSNYDDKNIVILTGDLHISVFGEITFDRKKIASEIVTTAISSRAYNLPLGYQWLISQIAPQVKYVNADYRGYSLVQFTRRKTDVFFYAVTTVLKPESEKILLKHVEIFRKRMKS